MHLVRPRRVFMPANTIEEKLRQLRQRHHGTLTLELLVEAGIDRLPFPASGDTLARWRVLAEVAAHDLSLAKLFEGHTDALAILEECGVTWTEQGLRWGTWSAEPPDARLMLQEHDKSGSKVRLTGKKAWCSGAATVTHALVSCWNPANEPCLAAVAISPPAVTVTDKGWEAVGMAASGSVDVGFAEADAVQIGRPGDYVNRPGFWHGGAGIAAVWFGGALGIARMTHESTGHTSDPHRLAHLGAIDAALAAAAAVLRETAATIDLHPKRIARREALRTRLFVEHAAEDVMHHAVRAVGAGPLCRNPSFARAMADLPVFLRQSHAERDMAQLGELALDVGGQACAL